MSDAVQFGMSKVVVFNRISPVEHAPRGAV